MTAESPSFEYEQIYSKGGPIAGLDEAGRGALAGPLYVGCVVFPPSYYLNPPSEILVINDSKKIPKKRRLQVYQIVIDHALFYDFEPSCPDEIDTYNINGATRLAVNRLLDRVPFEICTAILDGNFRFASKHPLVSLKKGDSLSLSVAAASIIAKVQRDSFMSDLKSEKYPYGFDKNVGYGTRFHLDAIGKYGPSDQHRRSYEPVRSLF
ncbi:MAG TPA: ribonuclease HII [Spirochaetota bacterium]|nr:ribonuclease HII [Spirochaetota bacterium]